MSFGQTRRSELIAALVDVTGEIRRLQARALGIVAEMDHNSIVAETGYPSLASLLVQTIHLAPRKASTMVAQAQQITETLTPTGHTTPAPLPTMRLALRDGAVDVDHLGVVTDMVKEIPDWASVQDRELVETTLTEHARATDPATLRKIGHHILDRIDHDGRQPDDKDLAEPHNVLRYRQTRTGRVVLTADIDQEAGEELVGMLTALGKPVPPAPGVPDPRSQQERHGEALAEIIHLAAKAEDLPARGGQKPHLSVASTTTTSSTASAPPRWKAAACSAPKPPDASPATPPSSRSS